MNINKKHFKYFCMVAFAMLFSYCSNNGSNILIVTNSTNDNLYIDFSKTRNPIDTVVKIDKDKWFRYAIFFYEKYSEKPNDTDVENELSKIIIFKLINNDTLYLPLETYNKIDKFEIGVDNDLGFYRKDFYLDITETMFE